MGSEGGKRERKESNKGKVSTKPALSRKGPSMASFQHRKISQGLLYSSEPLHTLHQMAG